MEAAPGRDKIPHKLNGLHYTGPDFGAGMRCTPLTHTFGGLRS